MSQAIFDALSKLTKAEPNPEHFRDFYAEAIGEKNDRGAAILLAANIENALESALVRILKNGRTSKLFGVEKPLGAFRNKIWIAYALDIFGNETFLNLECIRHIRNAFAHSKIPIRFDTPEIANVCALMKVPVQRQPVGALTPYPPPDYSKLKGRELFREVCNALGHNLHVHNLGGVFRIARNAVNASFDEAYTEISATHSPLP